MTGADNQGHAVAQGPDTDVYQEGADYQDICARCGKDYGKHRFDDDLCPGPFGAWDKSPGTTFRKRDVPKA